MGNFTHAHNNGKHASSYCVTQLVRKLGNLIRVVMRVSTYRSHVAYRIAQNSGGGKLWQIWRIELRSPIFYLAKFTYIVLVPG